MELREVSSREYVIDTTVLFFATSYERKIDHEAVGFLEVVRKYHIVALDADRRIENEYLNCIKRTKNELIKSWYVDIINTAGKTTLRSGDVPRCHLSKLEGLGFKEKDAPFLGVATRTKDRLLVFGEDRHYNNKVCGYAKLNWGVNIIKHNKCF